MKLTKDIIKKLIKENWESDVDDFNWWFDKSKENSNSAQTARNQKILKLMERARKIWDDLYHNDARTMKYQTADPHDRKQVGRDITESRLRALWGKIRPYALYATAEPLGYNVAEGEYGAYHRYDADQPDNPPPWKWRDVGDAITARRPFGKKKGK